MSGDQIVKTNFLVPDNIAEVLEENSLDNQIFTTTTSVTANGKKIQSKLNPHAQEFVPSFRQNESKIVKNDSIAKGLLPMESTENKQEVTKGKLDLLVEHFYQDFADTSMINACITENIDIQDVFETLKQVEEEENNEKKLLNKPDESTRKDELFVLFESTSAVVNTSSETVGSIAQVFITENLKIENKEVDKQHSKNTKDESNKLTNEENLPKGNNQRENCNQHPKSDVESELRIPLIKDTKIEKTNLRDKAQNKREPGIFHKYCRGNIEENKNINKLKHICSKVNSFNNQSIVPRGQGDTKKPINANEKTSKPSTTTVTRLSNGKSANVSRQLNNAITGRTDSTRSAPIKKVNFVQTNQNSVMKNDSIPKEESKESTIKRCSNAIPHSKVTATATKSNTLSKSGTFTSNKPPPTRPCKIEVPKSLNESSSSSTEKSFSSNRSTEHSNKPKASEKTLGQKSLAKECVVKPPKVTLTSQLRKAEARKRQNLFFDLESIKMSDFLFK